MCTPSGTEHTVTMSWSGVRVMVVDDQPPFRMAARAVLARTPGFAVVAEAASGEEAIGVALASDPDLVLMDINLPGIDGIEATRQILASAPHIVVFLCSTYERDQLSVEAMSSGAAAYVNKEEFSPALVQRLWAEPRSTRT